MFDLDKMKFHDKKWSDFLPEEVFVESAKDSRLNVIHYIKYAVRDGLIYILEDYKEKVSAQ